MNDHLLNRVIDAAQTLRFAQSYKYANAPIEKIEEQNSKADAAWQQLTEAIQLLKQNNASKKYPESIAIRQQPAPIHRPNEPAIVDIICEELATMSRYSEICRDLQLRKQLGIERYGTTLKANNGRSPLIDLYQELLDAVVYARQAAAEDVIPYCRYRDILISAENVRVLCESL